MQPPITPEKWHPPKALFQEWTPPDSEGSKLQGADTMKKEKTVTLSVKLQAELQAHFLLLAKAEAEKSARTSLKEKQARITWTPDIKRLCLDALEECGGNQRLCARTLQQLESKVYDKNGVVTGERKRWLKTIDFKTLRNWKAAAKQDFGVRGRKANPNFDQAVLSELILVVVKDIPASGRVDKNGKVLTQDDITSKIEVTVVANVGYSYSIIRNACENVQKRDEFKDDKGINSLKFSDRWIRDRTCFTRRKITNKEKNRPSVAEVQQIMGEIQLVLDEGKVELELIFNGDESGVFWCELPTHIYAPEGSDRGSAPGSNEKARFTVFLGANAKGE